jgi:hypothetical protein
MAIGMLERLSESEFWQKPLNRYATTVVAALLMAVTVAGSAWLAFRPSADPTATGATLWLCKNGHQFTMTARQLDDFYAKHYGAQITCPECGAPARRAITCPHCGNVVAPEPGQRVCPICKQPLYPR